MADFDQWLSEQDDETGAVRRVAAQGSTLPPEAAAAQLRLSQTIGAPKEYTSLFPDTSEQSRRVMEIDDHIAKAPGLRTFLADPENYAVAHDDLPQLSWWAGMAAAPQNISDALARAGKGYDEGAKAWTARAKEAGKREGFIGQWRESTLGVFDPLISAASAATGVKSLDIPGAVGGAGARARDGLARDYQIGEEHIELAGLMRKANPWIAAREGRSSTLTPDEQKRVAELRASIQDKGAQIWGLSDAVQNIPMVFGAIGRGVEFIPKRTGETWTSITGEHFDLNEKQRQAAARDPSSPQPFDPNKPIGADEALFKLGFAAPISIGAGIMGAYEGINSFTYETEAGLAYDEFLQMRAPDGRPASEIVGEMRLGQMADQIGAVNATIEAVGLAAFAKIVGLEEIPESLGKAAAMRQVKETLQRKLLSEAAAQLAGRAIAAGIEEGVTEGLQELGPAIAADEIADATGARKPTFGEQVSRVLDAAHHGFQAGIVLGGIGSAPHFAADLQSINESQRVTQMMDEIGKQSTASKLRQRLPEKYAQAVEIVRASQGGPLQQMPIDAEKFAEHFESQGIDPYAVAKEVGIPREQLDQALAAGGTVDIPIGQYAAKIAPTPHHEAMWNNARILSNGMTPAEMARVPDIQSAWMKQAEQIRREVDDRAAHAESEGKVYDAVLAEFQKSGAAIPEAARHNAKMAAALWTITAHKMSKNGVKVDPWTAYSERPLDVRTALVNEDGDAAADMMDQMRRGTRATQFIADAYAEMNTKDIAEKYKTTEGNVRVSIAKFRAGVRKYLAEGETLENIAEKTGLEVPALQSMLDRGLDAPDALEDQRREYGSDVRDWMLDRAEGMSANDIADYWTEQGAVGLSDGAINQAFIRERAKVQRRLDAGESKAAVAKAYDVSEDVIDALMEKMPSGKKAVLRPAIQALDAQNLKLSSAEFVERLRGIPGLENTTEASVKDARKKMRRRALEPLARAARRNQQSLNQSADSSGDSPDVFFIKPAFSKDVVAITINQISKVQTILHHQKRREEPQTVRYAIARDGTIYIWDGNLAIHNDVAEALGVPLASLETGEINDPRDMDLIADSIEELAASGNTPEELAELRSILNGVDAGDGTSRPPTMDEIYNTTIMQRIDVAARKVKPTLTIKQAADIAVLRERKYVVDGKTVRFDEAVDHLVNVYSDIPGGVARDHKAFFVLGYPGAGKSTYVREISREFHAATIDADIAKELVPGYDNGAGTQKVHNESSALRNAAQAKMEMTGANMIIERVGDNISTMERTITDLNARGYSVYMIHVGVSPDEAVRRSTVRYLQTGRSIAPSYMEKMVGKVPPTVEALTNYKPLKGYVDIDAEGPRETAAITRQGGESQGLSRAIENAIGRVLGELSANGLGRGIDPVGNAARLRELTPDQVADEVFQGEPTELNQSGDIRKASIIIPDFKQGLMRGERALVLMREASDLSSFMHEFGHYALAVYQSLANEENAPAAIVEDFNKIKAWMASDESVRIITRDANRFHAKRLPGSGRLITKEEVRAVLSGSVIVDRDVWQASHELFARTFEAYLLEGKSPSLELRQVFQAFKEWLRVIYKTVLSLDANLNTDIRDVLDRMVASEDQIAEVQKLDAQGLMTREQFPGTDNQWNRYQLVAARAKQEAEDDLRISLMHTYIRAQKASWARQKAAMRQTVERDIDEAPERRAFEWLAYGRWKGDVPRKGVSGKDLPPAWGPVTPPEGLPEMSLDTGAVIDDYGADALAALPVELKPMDKGRVDGLLSEVKEVRKKLRRKGPRSLIQAIKDLGGIRDDSGDVLAIIGRKQDEPGLINAAGRDLDNIIDPLWEQGYFGPGPGRYGQSSYDQRVWDALTERWIEADPSYSEDDAPAVEGFVAPTSLDDIGGGYGRLTARKDTGPLDARDPTSQDPGVPVAYDEGQGFVGGMDERRRRREMLAAAVRNRAVGEKVGRGRSKDVFADPNDSSKVIVKMQRSAASEAFLDFSRDAHANGAGYAVHLPNPSDVQITGDVVQYKTDRLTENKTRLRIGRDGSTFYLTGLPETDRQYAGLLEAVVALDVYLADKIPGSTHYYDLGPQNFMVNKDGMFIINDPVEGGPVALNQTGYTPTNYGVGSITLMAQLDATKRWVERHMPAITDDLPGMRSQFEQELALAAAGPRNDVWTPARIDLARQYYTAELIRRTGQGDIERRAAASGVRAAELSMLVEINRKVLDGPVALDQTGRPPTLDNMGFYSAAMESAERVPDNIWALGWPAARNAIIKGRDGYTPKRSELRYLALDAEFDGTKLRGAELRDAVLGHIEKNQLVLDEAFNRFDPGEQAIEKALGAYDEFLSEMVKKHGDNTGLFYRLTEEEQSQWMRLSEVALAASEMVAERGRMGEVRQEMYDRINRENAGIRRGPGDIRLPGNEPVFEWRAIIPAGVPGADFEGHWSRSPSNNNGVLVSVRGEERIDDKGGRTLFAGEVQSDIGQEVRSVKEAEANYRAKAEELEAELSKRPTRREWLLKYAGWEEAADVVGIKETRANGWVHMNPPFTPVRMISILLVKETGEFEVLAMSEDGKMLGAPKVIAEHASLNAARRHAINLLISDNIRKAERRVTADVIDDFMETRKEANWELTTIQSRLAMLDAPLAGNTQSWTNVAVRAMVYRAAALGFNSVSFPTAETSTLIQGNNDAASHYETNVVGALRKIAKQFGGEVREGSVAYNPSDIDDWSDLDPIAANTFLKKLWDRLPIEARMSIRKNMPYMRRRQDGGRFYSSLNVKADENDSGVSVDTFNWTMKNEARGNPLIAAYQTWVQGAIIWQEPGAFENLIIAAGGNPDVVLATLQEAKEQGEQATAYVMDITPAMRGDVVQRGFPLHQLSNRPSIQDLLDAIAQTHSGYPVFSQHDDDLIQERNYWQDQADWLDKNGIDINANAATIRTQIQALLDRESGTKSHPDDIAAAISRYARPKPDGSPAFSSGSELLKALASIKPRRAAIEAELERRMVEEYGDPMKDGSMMTEARMAAHAEMQARKIEVELEAIERASGSKRVVRGVAREAARAQLQNMTIRQIKNADWFLAAERRAAQASVLALETGDWREAAFHKQRQLLNFWLYREAKEEGKKIERAETRWKRLAESPNVRGKIDADYLDKIDALLEGYELRKSYQSHRQGWRNQELIDWVAEMEASGQGDMVAIDPRIIAAAGRRQVNSLRLEEFDGLRDTIANLEHLGRLKDKLLAQQEQRRFDAVVDELEERVQTEWPKQAALQPSLATKTPWEVAIEFAKDLHGSQVKAEYLARYLDGIKDGGPWLRTFIRPAQEAESALAFKREDATRRFTELLSVYDRKELGRMLLRKQWIPEINDNLTKMQMLTVALNMGNADNKDALMQGYKWNPTELKAVLAGLDKRDWDFAQSVWDYLDSFRNESFALEREMTGVTPKRVEPEAVETVFGAYRGGYFPLKYDADLSDRARRRANKEAAEGKLNASSFRKAATKRGHLKERVGSGGQAVSLDGLTIISQHVENSLHDVTHRKLVYDVTKLLADPRILSAIRAVMGKQGVDVMEKWIKNIANPSPEVATSWERVFAKLRNNVTIVNMGFKITTATLQLLGSLQAIPRNGVWPQIKQSGITLGRDFPVFLAQQVRSLFGAPQLLPARVQFVFDRSDFMKNRMKSYDRDIKAAMHSAIGAKPGVLPQVPKDVSDSFFHLTALIDMAVCVPTWLAAYENALSGRVAGIEQGSEADAIAHADGVVRTTQAAGAPKDLSAAMADNNAFWRLMTMFMSWANTFYNQLFVEQAPGVLTGKISRARFAANMLFIWFLPALLTELFYGRFDPADGEDDDDAWMRGISEIMIYPLQTIPVIRDAANAYVTGYDYAMSPAQSALESPIKLHEAVQSGDPDRILKNAFMVAGYAIGLPTRQLWTTAEGLWDIATGEDDLSDPADTASEVLLRDKR